MNKLEEKNYYKEYSKNYYLKNKDYFKDYYLKNKEKMKENHEKYLDSNKGEFVYFHLDKDGEVLYVGSYLDRPIAERQSAHLTGNSNLKMTAEEYKEKYGLDKIIYKDYFGFMFNLDELHFVENYFIEKYKPILNKVRPKFNEDNFALKKEGLEYMAEAMFIQEFDLEKYLKGDNK
ncbi:MAG: hypothetical protein E6845_11195 [Clostridium sp.]|uniref:hypothetical protein n=1 Tax=Clostridium sp. TaxID=1506 RepID=UPI0029047909|nr:hypothetical protein [Clostridium sp.]MDU1603523.1 hypothetical protein [Clostridium sp.]